MRKIFFIIALICCSFTAYAADTYSLDPNHASVAWSVNHFGFSNPSGKFTNIEGTITLDEQNPQNSSVDITIKTASISTGLTKFDDHLKSSELFNVEKFPTAKFVSSAVTSIRDNEAQVRGNLTLLGVTKMVTLDVKINKIGLNPINQKKTVGISASTLIKRSDFAINFGLPGVSDNVKIKIEVEGNLIISDENSSSPTLDTTYSTTPRIAQWKIIPAKSSLEFKADQENSSVKGSFKNFSGEIYFDKNQLSKSKISIEVDTSSVDTSFAEALDTLKSAAWLGVQGFPKATFTAEKFTAISASQAFRADGVLTIKGKSSPISIEFTLEEYSKTNARAVGKTTFKRSLFNIGDRDFRKANGVKDDIEINFTVSAER